MSAGPVDFDPGAILRVLIEHDVRFVVIGGFAALAHGSPFPTEDLDVTPDPQPDNLARLSAALTALEARVRTAEDDAGLPFAHDAHSVAAASSWNLVTRHGDLDVALRPDGTTGYPDLVRDAVVVEVFGATIRLASLADVVRSKQAANRPKDQRVLPVLREILAERPRADCPAPSRVSRSSAAQPLTSAV